MSTQRASIKYQFFKYYLVFAILVSLVCVGLANYFIYLGFSDEEKLRREQAIELVINSIKEAKAKDGERILEETFVVLAEEALNSGIVLSIKENGTNRVVHSIKKITGKDKETLLKPLEERVLKRVLIDDPKISVEEVKLSSYRTAELFYYEQFYYTIAQRELIVKLNTFMFIAVLLMVITSVLLGLFLSNKFYNPIKNVISNIQEVTNSEELVTVKSESRILELNLLIESFNKLSLDLYDEKIKRSKLIRSYAHELRTPIQIISSIIEGVTEGVITLDEERLEAVYEELLRLNKLVSDVEKAFEISKESLNKEILDIHYLLKQGILVLERDIKKKGLRIQLKNKGYTIFADKEKIQQVIFNLLTNAVKYSYDGGEIIMDTEKKGNKVLISIKNTSIPIPEDELENIFDYFYRTNNSKEQGDTGSGLGLAISKSIILAHNGEIEAKSIQGYGNEFIVKL